MEWDHERSFRNQTLRREMDEPASSVIVFGSRETASLKPISIQTSNDLLFVLHGVYVPRDLNYDIVAQNANEVQDIQNAPAISMGAYLENTRQTELLTSISVYSQQGTSRDQIRLLYMNSVALLVWQTMGRSPRLIGAQHRPPKSALLAFGVPFSE